MPNWPTTVPIAAFSATVSPVRVMAVGASLTLVTVIVKVCSLETSFWSVPRTRMVYVLFVSKSNEAAVVNSPEVLMANEPLLVLPSPSTSV